MGYASVGDTRVSTLEPSLAGPFRPGRDGPFRFSAGPFPCRISRISSIISLQQLGLDRERERERQSSFVFLAARVPANHGVLVTSGCKGNRCRLPGHFRCHCDFSWETRGWVLWIRVQSDFTTFLTKSFQFSCDLFWSRCHCHRPCSDPHQPPNCWVEMT